MLSSALTIIGLAFEWFSVFFVLKDFLIYEYLEWKKRYIDKADFGELHKKYESGRKEAGWIIGLLTIGMVLQIIGVLVKLA